MPKIKFTADPKLPRDLKHLGYKAGTIVDLPRDQADRWIRRGAAVETTEAAPEVAKPVEPTVTGDGSGKALPPVFDPDTADLKSLKTFLAGKGERGVSFLKEDAARARAKELLAAPQTAE